MAGRNIFKLGALEAQKTAFLLCDIQETFRPHIKHFGEVVKVANKMVSASKIFKIPVYVSEQYPKGLGHTTKDIKIDEAAMVYEKTKFSMFTPELQERLSKDVPNLASVVLFGIEAHVCIEQTVIDLLKEDIAVHILADGVSSRSLMDRSLALQRFQALGCFVTTSENVLFKLMKDKQHPGFKQISKLVKKPTTDTLGFDIVSKLAEDASEITGTGDSTSMSLFGERKWNTMQAHAYWFLQLLWVKRLQSIGCFVGTSENVLFKLLVDKTNPAFKDISKLNVTPTPDEFGLKTIKDVE